MEGFGLALIVFAMMAWHYYAGWRDSKRWNNGICKETGQFWEFTGGVSYLGMFCYQGGLIKGDQQFIWLHELRKSERRFGGGGPGTSC